MTTFADKNTDMRHANEYSNTLTREQRRQAKEKMVAQFAELLDRSPDENLYWMETKTDLIDLSHEAYMSEKLLDGQGRPYGFDRIVERACAVLHGLQRTQPQRHTPALAVQPLLLADVLAQVGQPALRHGEAHGVKGIKS